MTEGRDPLTNCVLTLEALNAMEQGAVRRGADPLSTVGLIVAIITVDTLGVWENIQLNSNFLDLGAVSEFPDPAPESRGVWNGVPLTATATTSLGIAAKIAVDYLLLPIPSGVLALGLLSNPLSGAAQALLDGAEITHERLLELVQEDILDVTLNDFGSTTKLEPPDRDWNPIEPRPSGRTPSTRHAAGIRGEPPAPRSDTSSRRHPATPPNRPAGATRQTVPPREGGSSPSDGPAGRAAAPTHGGPPSAVLAGADPSDVSRLPSGGWLIARPGLVRWAWDLSTRDRSEVSAVHAAASLAASIADIDGMLPVDPGREIDGWLVVDAARPGETLHDHLRAIAEGRRGRLPAETYASMLAEAATTLDEIHARGVTHRAVSPDTLILETSGRMFVASQPTPDGQPTSDRYTAPELLDGHAGPAADQFALASCALDIYDAPAAAPLTGALGAVLKRATRQRSADRFATAGEFGKALVEAVDEEAPLTTADRLERLSMPWRYALGPGFAIALLWYLWTIPSSTETGLPGFQSQEMRFKKEEDLPYR